MKPSLQRLTGSKSFAMAAPGRIEVNEEIFKRLDSLIVVVFIEHIDPFVFFNVLK